MSNGNKRRGVGCFLFGSVALMFSLLVLAALVMGVLAVALGLFTLERGPGVAVLEVYDELMDERPVLEQLDQLLHNPETKALVVRVDSPGGVITVVEEIYDALKRAAEDGTPVVASMGSLGTSGAYYVCLAAEQIYANSTSLTGSIGVLVEYPSAEELFKKIGIDYQQVTSGEFKGAGSLSQPLTERQREHFQEVVNDFHAIFVETVAKERDLDPGKVTELADGRVFTGRQAKELGLVDAIGDLEGAINYAASQAGIEGKPRIIRVREERLSLFELFHQLGAGASAAFRRRGLVPKYVLR